MLEDAVTKARRLLADLERDVAALDQQSDAKTAVENALAAARRVLEALQEAAKSENLR